MKSIGKLAKDIGTRTLTILSVGQFMNVVAVSVGLILIMTGHEDDTFEGLAIVTIANVILNVLLIPIWGLKGAAVANAVSTIIWNILLGMRVVHRRLGIYPSTFGLIKQGKGA